MQTTNTEKWRFLPILRDLLVPIRDGGGSGKPGCKSRLQATHMLLAEDLLVFAALALALLLARLRLVHFLKMTSLVFFLSR